MGQFQMSLEIVDSEDNTNQVEEKFWVHTSSKPFQLKTFWSLSETQRLHIEEDEIAGWVNKTSNSWDYGLFPISNWQSTSFKHDHNCFPSLTKLLFKIMTMKVIILTQGIFVPKPNQILIVSDQKMFICVILEDI